MLTVITWLVRNYSSISSGLLSGGLHAITGPDHFTALLPVIIHVRWWRSSMYGGSWGFGHGLCSLFLGLIGCTMKEMILSGAMMDSLIQLGFLSDLVIGSTIIVVAGMGMLEAIEAELEEKSSEKIDILEKMSELSTIEEGLEEEEEDENRIKDEYVPLTSNLDKKLPSTSLKSTVVRSSVMMGTVLVNGFVMGLSWDGLPSLTPAMIFNPTQALAFLLAYLVSTAMVMALAAGLIGEATLWLSRRLSLDHKDDQEHFSTRFTLVTSFVAFLIGFLWLLIGAWKGLVAYFPLLFPLSLRPDITSVAGLNNDGVAMGGVNNDGIEFSASPMGFMATASLTDESSLLSVEFYGNLLMSSLSLMLMVGSVVISVFSPHNLFERSAGHFALRFHAFYEEAMMLLAALKRKALFSPISLGCVGLERKDED